MDKEIERQVKLEAMYSEMNGKWICKEYFRTVIDSLKNIDDISLRQKVLAHPYTCKHPTCQGTMKFMREVTGK